MLTRPINYTQAQSTTQLSDHSSSNANAACKLYPSPIYNATFWSRVRYHCATDPLPRPVNYTQAQYTTQLSDLECEMPTRLYPSPIYNATFWSRVRNANAACKLYPSPIYNATFWSRVRNANAACKLYPSPIYNATFCWLFGLDLTLINFNQLIDVLMITNLLFNY